ncbi:B- and T-lymphocyte attenuator isoform X1 [Pangasianodon hypophthalmus]|uniref:B- and T-lymphocyte attenuator isoform X1 n=2 Tax=Pangasianodon hypophthalmus TaxID=310915 RepID=UPI002308119F|nr:B- and T-lymphocyte attenuator isoform X1 [Pangasianodon hypophthalmus]
MLCTPAPPGTPDFVCGKKRFFMACCVFQIICILIIHLWLSPLISSNTNESDLDCIPSIMVPRNTVWKAPVMKSLTINCTVDSESHCWKNINVTWCRIDDKNECRALNRSNYTTNEWEKVNKNKRLLFLIFHNISMKDAGLYRCRINSPTPTVSHSINVTVTDYVPDCNTDSKVVTVENNTTNSSNPIVAKKEPLQPYVYIYSGIGVLLLVVVVVSVIVIWCRGQKKSIKEKIHENQSTATPVADLAPPIYNPRESPRSKTQTLPAQLSPPTPSIYDIPPVRVTSLRDRSSAGGHPVNRGSPIRCHNRDTVETEEDENPLIYATLNHGAVPQRPVRVAHVQIEASEYAAIKVT